MAFPRVFISSTCYDLGEIRDNLVTFIKTNYFEPVLSERGDVFYHPDFHTHDSCIHEIENIQLFILIIGGRFGGNYIADTSKSIVNAEYLAARDNDIPVFCFIKKEVYEDHRVYQRNKKNKEIIQKIIFPSIEKQEHSINIFRFIDQVRLSPVNNGIFPFEFAREIQEILGKQWAGMFCDFLYKRKYQKNIETTSTLLSQLTIASQKTEEIIKNVYMYLDKEKAPNIIENINKEAEAKRFFELVLKNFKQNSIPCEKSLDIEKLINVDEETTWVNFLEMTGIFFTEDCDLVLFPDLYRSNEQETNLYKEFKRLFKLYKNLDKEQRRKVLEDYIKRYGL